MFRVQEFHEFKTNNDLSKDRLNQSGSPGDRTLDLRIKSPSLYQLS